MRYVKTDDYDSFVCLAGGCPDTCCAGWEIVIDEHSLEAYAQRTKAGDTFAGRLARSVDWEESVFRQTNRRCAFLEDNDLCALYTAMGPEALCDTCRNYPRHMEEFEGLREYSLSLSCPEAAGIILTGEKPQSFLTEEDDTEDEIFDDMDLLLFSQLEDARAAMFEILQDQTLKMQNKKDLIVHMAADIQRQIDENEYFKIDETIQNYKKKENSFKIEKKFIYRRRGNIVTVSRKLNFFFVFASYRITKGYRCCRPQKGLQTSPSFLSTGRPAFAVHPMFWKAWQH